MKLLYGLFFVLGFQVYGSEPDVECLVTYLQQLHNNKAIKPAHKVQEALTFLKLYEEDRVAYKASASVPVRITATPAIQPKKIKFVNLCKVKKEKVIAQNLDILLNDKNRGSAGKYFDHELYNSEAFTCTVREAVRTTIEVYRPKLKEAEVQDLMKKALYYNLKKDKKNSSSVNPE